MERERRLLLIDPEGSSRAELRGTLSGVGAVRVVRTCSSYDEALLAADESGCELALIVLDADPERALATIRQLRVAAPRVALLPASRSRDGETILRSLRAGAHEFLPLPAEADEVREVIDRLLPGEDGPGESGGKLLAVIGSAGGVGCTTLAVNLAAALARAPGASVALVDLDMLLGAIDVSLDLLPELTIADVVADIDRYDETLLRRALIRHESGIHVLPAPTAIEDAARVDPEALRRVLELLRRAFSFVVVDASKGLQATDFVALELAEAILMLTQLDVCGLRNGARLMQVLRQCDGMADRVRVVANRVGSEASTIGLKQAEVTLGTRIAWQVSNASEVVMQARSKGTPFVIESPKSRPAREVLEIARAYAPMGDAAAPKKKKPLRNAFAAIFT